MHRNRGRARWWFPLFAAAILCAGCIRTEVFDQLGMITVAGYDLIGERLEGTVIIPSINPEAKEKIQIISGISQTSKGIQDKTNLQSDKEIVSGQLRVAVYSMDLAKKGVNGIVDTLYRDPAVGSRVYLCVSEGKAKDLLSHQSGAEGNIGIYLYQMIQHNVRQDKIPSPTLHEFMRAIFSEGIDPYLPIVEKRGRNIAIKGLALFDKDKYVGWVTPREAFFIKLIQENYRTGTYEMSTTQEALGLKPTGQKDSRFHLVFDTIRSKANMKILHRNPLVYDVSIKLEARVLEMTKPLKLEESQVAEKVEKVLAENMKKELAQVVGKIQKLGVDPFGFGEIYRSQTRGGRALSHKDLHRLFQEAEMRYQVDVKIIRNGVMD